MRNKKTQGLPGVFRWAAGVTALAVTCTPTMAADAAPAVAPGKDASSEAREVASEANALPMTKNVISRGALDRENPQDGYEALKSVAGVTNASAKGTISDNLNIRGIQLDTYSSYRLNGGVSLVNIIAIPSENKERIEALKGANALMYGLASPAGIVNLVTKQATTRDVTAVGLSANVFGQYGGNVDVGRRFGEGKPLGLRVNLAATHLETGVDGGTGHAYFGSIAADWHASERLKFKFDFEHYSRDVIEQSQIQQLKPVNGVIAIPRLPDPTRLLSGSWAHYRPTIENVQLRVDFAFSAAWGLLGEAGRSTGERSRFITRINGYDVVTGEGTNNVTFVKDQKYVNTYAKGEALGKFDTGPIAHALTLGVMAAERDANTPSVTTIRIAQNIYNPRVLAEPASPTGPQTFSPQDAKNVGVYFYDAVSIGNRWKVLAGMRRTQYDATNTLANGTTVATSTTKYSPALGAIFQVTPAVAFYASFMKGLEETGTAPVGTVNQLSFLPPAEATQKEVGLRATLAPGIATTAAYFDITRANAVTNMASNVFLIDGTTRFQGLEATLNAELERQWSVNAGGQLMKARQNSKLDLSIKGLAPENTPTLSGNLSLSFRPDLLPGVSLTTGASYNGSRYINPQNQGSIPAVTVYSAGIGYSTKFAGRKTALQLNVDNLSNKSYWNSASGGAYGIGMVRSVKFSAKVDL